MIRVVLAVVLTTALFGVAFPGVERADRERNAVLATEELETIADTAADLQARNDPIESGNSPAGTTVAVTVPEATFATGGRIRIDDDGLHWLVPGVRNETVDVDVPFRVQTPITITDGARIQLSYVQRDEDAVILVDRRRP